MTNELAERQRYKRARFIVIAYPIVILLIALILNIFVFGVKPAVVALPSINIIYALVISAVLLTLNHTWIMTATELTRERYKIYATFPEQQASGIHRDDISEEGLRALERYHNIHRNSTENIIYFIFLALIFMLVSPGILAAQLWLISFAIARLGYTFSYLNDSIRGLFMSLGLLAMYGVASYLVLSLLAGEGINFG